MALTPERLATMSQDLLDLAVGLLPTPPERQYVSHGEPAYDCDQLTVHLERLRPKIADRGLDTCMVAPVAPLVVTLLRCITNATEQQPIPPADVIHAENLALLEDGWRLWKGLTRAWATGAWPADVPCDKVRWGVMEPRGPSGYLAGWRIGVEVEFTP